MERHRVTSRVVGKDAESTFIINRWSRWTPHPPFAEKEIFLGYKNVKRHKYDLFERRLARVFLCSAHLIHMNLLKHSFH